VASSGGCNAISTPGRQKDMKLVGQAKQLKKEGKSLVEIARIIGRDKSTICKWLKED
jgi:hypothetical protein